MIDKVSQPLDFVELDFNAESVTCEFKMLFDVPSIEVV